MGKSGISLSVLLLISVLWKPAFGDDKCEIGCKGSPSTQAFLNGHKYSYGVEGTVTIFLTGADKQETSVKLLGQVAVTATGNCAHELNVLNLVISGPDGKKYQSPPGLEKPVRFAFQDGRVGADICAEEGDTRRSLNIKRAIISLLQTENKPSTQVDIFGTCPTDASSSQEGGAVLVHRTRDLSRCGQREQGKNDLITAVYNPSAEIKSTQVLQSSLNVESKVNNGVPEKVSASEEYLYKPFSVGENGARAKVHTKLTLTGTTKGAGAASHCTETRTIIFESPHGVTIGHSNYQAALAAVKDTAKTLTNDAGSKSAGNFAQLVRILRTVSKDDLTKIFNSCKSSDLEKRVFLDGLIRAGTGPSIEASINILKSKQLTTIEQHLVFLSLGNARHVNNDALKAAASLLDLPNLPKEIYIGVGALAGVFCREHNCHDGGNDGIAALSQKLSAKLQNCKPKGKIDEDNVVAVLKGIRNIRHLENSLVEKVVRCATDNNVKARVRVAALEAFHADPCATKLHKAAIDLFKNRNQDSEIRIKAYLAVIECPCAHSATEIKNLLETEPVHQVGHFITSSLRHIRASANPDKRLARQHYGQIRTPNKFNIDDRKYSFYREVSYTVDALGVGGEVDQTVIYSQDSFLPRSVSYNLTAELFGHSLNILEVGGRQGNLDRVAEHFFGPRNFFHREEPQKVYDNIVKRFQESKKRVDESLSRGRRSIKSEIDNFDKALKAEATPYNHELDLDIYVKLFGTDAVFLSLGDDKGFDLDKALDEILKFANTGINQVKNFQQEVRAHLLFLDAELSYPTSTGLPLKLDLTGAATARVDVSTNIDIRQILQSPQNAKIDIKFVPSTDIEVSGLFLVDADSVSTGLKVVTNLRSSTGSHIIAKILENGKGFDLQFGLPVDKQEILTATNDLVYVTIEKGQKEKVVALKVDAERKEYAGCFDQLSGVLGLTFCGEVSVPFSVSGNDAQASISKFLARYPLTGSSRVRLAIEKNDLRGYHVKGVYRTDGKKHNVDLLFDAEGSKNRRTQLTGELALTQELYTVKLALESPIKTLSGEITLQKKPTELYALIKAKVDASEYYGKAGFSIQGDDKRSVFKPIFEYQLPGDKDKHSVQIEGQAVRESDGSKVKYSIQNIHLRLPNVKDPIDISGHFTLNEPPHDVIFNIVVKNKATLSGSKDKNSVLLEFQNTLNPFVNFRLNVHSDNKEGQYHNDIELAYGGDLKQAKNRVIFNQLLKHHKNSLEDFNVITKNKFEICSLPLILKLEADLDPKKVDFELEGVYIDNSAKFDLEARTKIKKQGDYSVKIIADVNKEGIEVFAKRDIVSADKSNLENYLILKNRSKYELSGVLLHKTKANDVNVGAIGHFKITAGGKTDDIKFDIGAIENNNLYSSHAKVGNGGGDLVDFLLKIVRGANPSGTLKLILKDSIAANGQFKVTDSDGKGNGAIIIDFKKAQRKIKGDVKFQVKDPVYSGEFDIFLNFDKDNNDKVHFYTFTKKTDKAFETKNKLEYGGKKTELNVRQDGGYTNNGKTHSNIEVVLPTERCLSLKVDRDVTTKDGVFNGHVDLLLSDAEKRGSSASTISYKGTATNINLEKETINYEGQLELHLKGGKQLQNVFYLKNNPEGGDKFKFEFKSDVTGNLIAKPASLLATYTYLSADTIFDDNYRLKGSFGDDIGFELAGVFEVKLFEKGDKKYLDDFTVTTRLPFEKAHDLKWVSTILYLQPENKDTAEFTITESLQINADVYKVDANGKVNPNEGNAAIKLLVPHNDPVTFNVNYKNKNEGDKHNNFAEVKAKYGKGKSASVSLDSSIAPHDNSFTLKANVPQAEKLKKLEVNVHSKNPAPDTYSSTIIIDADGRVYKSVNSVVVSKANPLLDFQYTSPSSPKTSRVYLKGSSLSSTQGKAELKIENIHDLSLDATSEANIQKDNVQFKLAANSEKLGFKNYQVEIASKDSGSGKRLEFQATNDNKNVLSGSTSFISKQEGQKTIVEGSGSVKVKEEQKSANFKYIRTILTEGNEKGVETFFNIAIGERSYVAESRVTNLEYKTSYVYCEEKKQCAHAELQSKVDVSKPGVIANLINAGFDLRKLGLAPEFGLQVKDEVSDKRPPQYTLDVHVNKEDKKYHLHVYNTPEFGNSQSGITVQLPQRALALESKVSYPINKQIPFPIKGELSLDLDKNKQGHKTSGRFFVDINVDDDKRQTATAEFGFNHPKINKEAVIKIGGLIARPAENTVKIETHASLCHPSLGADRESKLLFEANPTSFKLLIDTPIAKVIDIEGSATLNEKLQEARLSLNLLQCSSLSVHGRVQDLQEYQLLVGVVDPGQPDNEVGIQVTGHIKPEQRVDCNVDFINGKDRKSIVHGALFLQNNEVKSDYGVSKDNFNNYVTYLKNELKNLETRVKQLVEKGSNDFKAALKRVEPTFKNLEKAYADDLKTFYNDIANDKTLKDISHALNDIVQYFAKLIDVVVKATKPIVDNIVQTYTETAKKIHDLYEKQIEPQLKQLYATISGALKEYLDVVVDIVAHFAAIVTDFFEKHKPELKELTSTLAEIFKDLTRLLVVQLKEFQTAVSHHITEITRSIKELPIFKDLKDKWQSLQVPEQVLEQLKQVYSAIKVLLPTQETRDFADALNAYVQKKLRAQKCDDAKELRALYGKLSTAITSLVQYVRAQIGQFAAPAAINYGSFLYPGSPGQSAPAFGGKASLSLINQVLQGDIPDPLSLVRAYRPRSLNPFDEIPSKLRAVIVNGQHIFTFDGRHLTFPGNCRYVLAHDHVDRNFTLLTQLQNGQPKALVIEDKSGTIIELKDNGQVTLNGAAHGFPVIEKDVFAFKQPNGRIGLGSLYGLMAFCTAKLEVCYIEVSGFYLGKLRGLLGDGNNEPYDDFRLPNGKICSSESEFGNAYRLAKSCPQVQAPEHSHHQLHGPLPPACEQVFGGTSPLRLISQLLDIAPFRQACVHACSGNDAHALQQACDLARGYAALALTGLLPAVLPDVCVRCTDADKPRNVGDTYEIKLPNKQADIIVAVETTKVNEKLYKELVVPLVSQVVDNLKTKRCSDIKVYLVGITSRFPYPIVYDTDLKLKNPKVAFPDESRYNHAPQIKTGNPQVDKILSLGEIVNGLRIHLGLTNVVAGYNSLLDLPLRAGAVKHTISVVGDRCVPQNFLVAFTRALAYGVVFDNIAYSHSLVTVTPALKVGGGKDPSQVVGFTKESVILLGDKKWTKEAEQLRSTLEVQPDGCVDFVESTDGFVLSSSNYQGLNPAQQKQYLQTAASAITQKLFYENLVQECECVYVDPFRVRSVCINKDRKEAARRRK